jgi:hypothetical protein
VLYAASVTTGVFELEHDWPPLLASDVPPQAAATRARPASPATNPFLIPLHPFNERRPRSTRDSGVRGLQVSGQRDAGKVSFSRESVKIVELVETVNV